MILKPVFIIAIAVAAMIGVMVPSIFAEPENAGALGSAHIHAGILVKIFGDEFDFLAPAYQLKSSWINFEERDGATIHSHATGVELEYLFNSLSIGLDDQCFVFPDGKHFCTNNNYSLKYFINAEPVSDIRDYIIQDNDRILITFGNGKNIQSYLSQLHSIEINQLATALKNNDDKKIAELMELEKQKLMELEKQKLMELEKQEEVKREISTKDGYAKLIINSNTYWSAVILDGNQSTSSFDGYGNVSYDIPCGKINIISLNLQKQGEFGYIEIQLVQNGKILSQASTTAQFGITSVASECLSQFGGGCLIATATYGSEMATEVQQLRELRDNQLLQTKSGTAFMGTFNDIYYSFSPIIADYERENPYFKEAVKIAITPMISSLSLMENAESESEVLSIGISVIALNLGMYLGIPAIVVVGIRKRF